MEQPFLPLDSRPSFSRGERDNSGILYFFDYIIDLLYRLRLFPNMMLVAYLP